MCLSNRKYPLLKDSCDGKRKVIFDLDFTYVDNGSIEELTKFQEHVRQGLKGSCMIPSFNSLNKNYKGWTFEKMVSIPCGRCNECLMRSSKDWATRVMLECKDHDNNWFLTLTYDDKHLPSDYNLDEKAISEFNKKLKKYLKRCGKSPEFRFYSVAEYGGKTGRPHYHGIYCGLVLDDLKVHSYNEYGQPLYESPFLSKVWKKGYVMVGEVTPASAAYVARYCNKKKRLSKTDKLKMKELGRVPEYSRMSLRPGIGANAYEKIKEEALQGRTSIQMSNGKLAPIPTAWSKKIKAQLEKQGGTDYDNYESHQKMLQNIYLNLKLNKANLAGLSYGDYLQACDNLLTENARKN